MLDMAGTTRLKQVREELGLSQYAMAKRLRTLNMRTYVRAEQGENVKYSTAVEIRDTVNELLKAAGKPSVTIEDLGLNLA